MESKDIDNFRAIRGISGGVCACVFWWLAHGDPWKFTFAKWIFVTLTVGFGAFYGSTPIRGAIGAILNGIGVGVILVLDGLLAANIWFFSSDPTLLSRMTCIVLAIVVGASFGGVLGFINHRLRSTIMKKALPRELLD